jgi:DNA-binding NarL/FixJ family response regulator
MRDRYALLPQSLEQQTAERTKSSNMAGGVGACTLTRNIPAGQTLACLLEGDSEKQVAARLGLSPATAHEYVTALYRHFGVQSRAQPSRMPQAEGLDMSRTAANPRSILSGCLW